MRSSVETIGMRLRSSAKVGRAALSETRPAILATFSAT